jgi:hypothetical protein
MPRQVTRGIPHTITPGSVMPGMPGGPGGTGKRRSDLLSDLHRGRPMALTEMETPLAINGLQCARQARHAQRPAPFRRVAGTLVKVL